MVYSNNKYEINQVKYKSECVLLAISLAIANLIIGLLVL
jgi:hypothetical protein